MQLVALCRGDHHLSETNLHIVFSFNYNDVIESVYYEIQLHIAFSGTI